MSNICAKLLLIAAIIFWKAELQGNVRVGLMTSSNYVGDREVAWRIKIAGERLGWSVFLDQQEGTQLNYHELDWVICMLPDNKISNLPCPNYLMVFHPFLYLDKRRSFHAFYEKYDGYLLTINDRDTLRNGLKRKNKEFHHIRFYPTVYSTAYQKLTPHDLVVMIPVWGKRVKDPKFKTLYKLLSRSGFAKFYGVNLHPSIEPCNYMGTIPFNGTSVLNTLQKHGIVLILHSKIHNEEAIPSSRIFEAAAASTVIISDENAFIKKHFGDSIFYIDTSGSGESIFHQIQEHMHAIFQDPEKALQQAEKAHQIFIEKFTMESQLLNLHAMHKRLTKEKKAD